MGGRDHSCETCGRGGLNDCRPCICPRGDTLDLPAEERPKPETPTPYHFARARAEGHLRAAIDLLNRCEPMEAVRRMADAIREAQTAAGILVRDMNGGPYR